MSFEDRKQEVHEAVVQSRWNSLEAEASLRVADFLSYDRVMEVNPFEVSRAHEAARRQFAPRLRRAVRALRLEPLWDRTLLALSNGERQRVELGRALCHPLRLLILDEPFTGLDAAMRRHFGQMLDQIMRSSVRVLLLTARVDDLPAGVTHVMVVRDCRAVTAGPRAKVLAKWRDKLAPVAAGLSPGRKATALPEAPGGGERAKASPLGANRPARGKAVPGTELVRLNRVTVRYGAATILEAIDWTVKAGEHWALLGPNGSGKTTLLSLILGDNPQVYNNEVIVFGRRRGTGESMWEIRQGIGWVSPELQLHFDEGITCLHAVASGFFDTVGLFEPPTARQRAAARYWLARFGLAAAAATPLYALSAGWQRMVLLARALVKRPRLLILDEPCQGLDAAHRASFLEAVAELLNQGRVTAIYVTHRREEIPRAVRRVLRLDNGVGTISWRRSGKEGITSPARPAAGVV